MLLLGLRLLVAAFAPLSPDEAYYWVWSRALAAGYLDHPPMVALWIRAGTALLGEGALGVRLLGPLSALAGTLLLVRAGEDFFPGRGVGVRAAWLLNATLLFALGSVTMTPDTPLLFFWTMALWALGRLLRTQDGWWWLVAGLAAGLAMASKYTGFFLPASIALAVVVHPVLRGWRRRVWPYAGGLLAAVVFAPVLVWNAAHGFASFAKQGGRVGAFDVSRAVQFLGELVGGQVGLFTPIIFVLCAAGAVLVVRRWADPGCAVLAVLTLLPVVVFVQHALGDRVQANWPAVLAPGTVIAAGALEGRWRRWIGPGVALGFVLTAVVWLQAAAAPLVLPMRLDPTLLRLGGWEALAGEIEAVRAREGAVFVVSDNYAHAALLARLLPGEVLGIDPRWALFDLPDARAGIAGKVGILVRSARRDDNPDLSDWARVERLGVIDRARHGMVGEQFRLYRVEGRAGDMPIAVMPHPAGAHHAASDP